MTLRQQEETTTGTPESALARTRATLIDERSKLWTLLREAREVLLQAELTKRNAERTVEEATAAIVGIELACAAVAVSPHASSAKDAEVTRRLEAAARARR